MVKRVLFISNLYPNPLFPHMASFNRQQLAALREFCQVEVISPIPWTALLRGYGKTDTDSITGSKVHHPVYFYPPRILRGWYGMFFLHSINRAATRLLRDKSFDLIYASWLYPDAWAAARLAKQFQLPLLVKVHGTDVNRLKPGNAVTRQSLDVASQACKVVCVSRALQDKLVSLGVPEHKLTVLYNGVDRSIFHPMTQQSVREQLGITPDTFLALFVGNLKKEKGLEELIAAFSIALEKIAAPARLIIIGSGEYALAAKQRVASLQLDGQVTFLGNQPLNRIACWMNAASVLCLPSYMEGVPNVVLEALSCGARVIASRVGGIPELETGDGMLTLIPPRDANALAKALESTANCATEMKGQQREIISWRENSLKLYSLMNEAV